MPGILDLVNALTGGLLGGQAPPQQRQQQQAPATLPGYGGGDNPLMAGFQNFTQAGSPMGALGGLVTGLTTGQRTDPVGAFQQRANMTYRALRQLPNVSDAQAQAGALDPQIQQFIIKQTFPQWEFQNINGTGVMVNKSTGQIAAAGAFRPETLEKVSPGENVYQRPAMFPGLSTAPGVNMPAPGAPGQPGGLTSPGAPGGPASVPSPTTPLPQGPAQRGVPVAAATGAPLKMVVQGQSPAQQAAATRQAEVQGETAGKLPKTVDDIQQVIDELDALVGNPSRGIPAHPGKANAIGPLAGAIGPSTGPIYKNRADFIRALDHLETIAAPFVGGDDKTKEAATGLIRQQQGPQFDRAAAALRARLVGQQEAARKMAGEPGTPSAPEAPQTSPPAVATGAPSASTAGQGAPPAPQRTQPTKSVEDRYRELRVAGATPNQARAQLAKEGY